MRNSFSDWINQKKNGLAGKLWPSSIRRLSRNIHSEYAIRWIRIEFRGWYQWFDGTDHWKSWYTGIFVGLWGGALLLFCVGKRKGDYVAGDVR